MSASTSAGALSANDAISNRLNTLDESASASTRSHLKLLVGSMNGWLTLEGLFWPAACVLLNTFVHARVNSRYTLAIAVHDFLTEVNVMALDNLPLQHLNTLATTLVDMVRPAFLHLANPRHGRVSSRSEVVLIAEHTGPLISVNGRATERLLMVFEAVKPFIALSEPAHGELAAIYDNQHLQIHILRRLIQCSPMFQRVAASDMHATTALQAKTPEELASYAKQLISIERTHPPLAKHSAAAVVTPDESAAAVSSFAAPRQRKRSNSTAGAQPRAPAPRPAKVCQFHPDSVNHTTEECRHNPANAGKFDWNTRFAKAKPQPQGAVGEAHFHSQTLDALDLVSSSGALTPQSPTLQVFGDGVLKMVRVVMMVDSGATKTLLSEEKAIELKLIDKMQRSFIRVGNADGSPLEVLGRVTFNARLPDDPEPFPINAHVVRGLAFDLLLGADNMWHRRDGRNVSLLANDDAPVCDIQIGSRVFRAEAAPASGNVQAIHAVIRAVEAALRRPAAVAPPTESVNAVIRAADTPPESITAAQIAAEAERATMAELAALGDEPCHLPEQLRIGYVPTVSPSRNMRLTELKGDDRQAFMDTIKSIASEFVKEAPVAAARIEKTFRKRSSVSGGRKTANCRRYPSASGLDPMSISIIPGFSIASLLPVKQVQVCDEDRTDMRKFVGAMKDAGIVSPANGAPALARAFIVREESREPRLVVAMQNINAISWPHLQPLPLVSALHDLIARFSYVAKFDVWAAFYQVPLDDAAVPLTTTLFIDEVLQFERVVMGLQQSPGHLQRVLSAAVEETTEQYVTRVYIDDIIIGAHSPDALADAIERLFEQLEHYHITIRASKSSVGATFTEILGAEIGNHEIRPTDDYVQAIRDYGRPRTVTELRRFNGKLAQLYPFGVSANSPEMHLLHDMASPKLAGGQKLVWSREADKAFLTVKGMLVKLCSTVPFSPELALFLLIDASNEGYGAVLAHLDYVKKCFVVIRVISGRWTAAERNYTTPEKEIAVLLVASSRFYYMMFGRRVFVLCDNAAVVQILSNGTNSMNVRIRNTAAKLLGFQFVVIHLPGALNTAADALSRDPRFSSQSGKRDADAPAEVNADTESISLSPTCAPVQLELYAPQTALVGAVLSEDEMTADVAAPQQQPAQRSALADILESTSRMQAMVAAQRADPDLFLLLKMAAGESPSASEAASEAWREACRLEPIFRNDWHGALFVHVSGAQRLVVPDGIRGHVVRLAHSASHLSDDNTVAYARRFFWWPTLRRDIMQAVAACAQCQRVNADLRQAPGNLGNAEQFGPPARCSTWELDSFNIGTALDSYRVLVALESFSGCVWAFVVESASASDALEAYINIVERPHGHPRRVFVDRGTEFAGEFEKHLKRNGVELIVGLVDNHHHVARVERANRTILKDLRQIFLAHNGEPPQNKAEAQEWIDVVTATLNSMPRRGGGFTRAELLFGFNRLSSLGALVPDSILSALDHVDGSNAKSLADLVRVHRAALLLLTQYREQYRAEAREASEAAYQRRHGPIQAFEVGQLVLARTPSKERDAADKINRGFEFTGPWRIISVHADRQMCELRLLFPLTTYGDKVEQPLEINKVISVHFSDIRDFVEGTPIDTDALLSPLAVGAPPTATPWGEAVQSAEHSVLMRAAVERLLTNEQRARLQLELDAASEQFVQRMRAHPLSSSLPTSTSTPAVSSSSTATPTAEKNQQLPRDVEPEVPSSSLRRRRGDSEVQPIKPDAALHTSKIFRIKSYSKERDTVTGLAVTVNGKRFEFGLLIERPVAELSPPEIKLLETFIESRELGKGRIAWE